MHMLRRLLEIFYQLTRWETGPKCDSTSSTTAKHSSRFDTSSLKNLKKREEVTAWEYLVLLAPPWCCRKLSKFFALCIINGSLLLCRLYACLILPAVSLTLIVSLSL